jgi:ribosomal protein L12E/L44/L45/RPP1/RPP2
LSLAAVSSVGVEADAADVERLLKELEGKDIHELIAAGEWQTKSSGLTWKGEGGAAGRWWSAAKEKRAAGQG